MTSAAGPDRTGFSRKLAPQARANTREEAVGAPGSPANAAGGPTEPGAPNGPGNRSHKAMGGDEHG